MNRLTGRVAVITGAARGIGRALTEGFLDEGATVVAVDRSWDGVEELRDEWQSSRSVMATTFDITDRAQVESVAADVVERFGTVDVLVNNVGLRMRDLYPQTWRVTVLDSTDADWRPVSRCMCSGRSA
jgi:NAD(P)-dependent dehydrogenase (short-subunit alcohol dehydrogenase family)